MPTTDIEDHNDIQLADGVTAYHGSPHEFEEFDPAFIGTGEGAQAYGHGLYFAENEDTAKQYSKNTEGKYSAGSIARRMLTNWGDRNTAIQKQKEHISRLEKDHKEDFITPYRGALNILESGKEPKTGHMYEVQIDAHPEEHILDWDKPLSEQHPKIQEAVSARIEHLRNKYPEWVPNDPEGEWIYRSYRPQGEEEIPPGIDHDAHASSSLKDLGVRGIRYADQGSRGVDEKIGSSNYVIFDPKHIKVKRRYAEGGGIKAFAIGNSIPHLERASDMIETHDDIQLAPGVEAIDEMPDEASYQDMKVGPSSVSYKEHPSHIEISSVRTPQKHRGKGAASSALNALHEIADKKGKKVRLLASPLDKKTRLDRLVNLYKKHGYELTGEKGNLAGDPWMERKPAKASGGSIIPGPKLTEENADDFARRLIAWTFATAPLFQRASGGAVDDSNGNWEDAFHATHADVQNFDLSKAGSGTTVGGSKAERAIFLTNDPENAKTYLGGQYVSRSKNPHTEEMPYGVGRHYAEGANIMPLKINTKDFDEWDYGGNLYDANHMKEIIKEARKSKAPGIKIENIKDQGYMGLGSGKKTTTYVVLDPSRIRSKFAKFDPKKSKKRDLMASDGGSVIDAALDVVSKLRR